MEQISWKDFEQVELRVGTIVKIDDFPQARNPAYIAHIDFGSEIGTKKSSAQITDNYTKKDLLEKQVVAVINFPAKQIGHIMSECLITGFYDTDGSVILAVPDKKIPNGRKIG